MTSAGQSGRNVITGVLNGGMGTALAFTEADIREAAGSRSFERGLGYLGAVADLEIGSSEATATVYGNSAYQVVVAFGDERLRGGCTCPQGQEGSFCKHCAAVALSVMSSRGAASPSMNAMRRAG